MKRYLCLILLISLSCLFTLGVCGCEEESQAKSIKFEVGQKFSRKIHSDSDLKMMFPNADKKTADMVLDYHVKSVDQNGIFTIEVTIASLKASVSTLGQAYYFDSEDPGAVNKSTKKDSQRKKFTRSFKGLKGKSYSARVDSTGKVIELVNMDSRIKSLSKSQTSGDILGLDQPIMLLSKPYLKEYVSPLYYANLHKAKITPKLTWEGTGHVVAPDVPMLSVQKSYKIDSIDTTKGTNTVTVSFTSIKPEVNEEEKPKAKVTVKKPAKSKTRFQAIGARGKGTITFDANTGKLIKATEFVSVKVKTKSIKTKPSGTKKRRTPKMLYYINRSIEAIEPVK